MPIFVYRCSKCGKEEELLLFSGENPPVSCKYCGGRLLKRVSSGIGLVFKGSGFYITDYKKKETTDTTDDKKIETSNPDKKTTAKSQDKS